MRVYPVRRAGDNGISFEDAPAVCSNLGGYLANTSDLQTAQRLGLHLCRCGILRNNSTRYSALYNGTNCSDYAGLPPPTIVTCKLPTTNTYLTRLTLVVDSCLLQLNLHTEIRLFTLRISKTQRADEIQHNQR
ncbi:hypothetical protein DPMN_184275 [Dreissena polymorpha]|uniref:Link domain-containing protein n=1 Tax=Dreissena polymorpha TaxID=45954 RepID=A0A9D4DHK2_DREPO|nr:hypothetical protein DPMN_184275 [Dreissena polymorpha]